MKISYVFLQNFKPNKEENIHNWRIDMLLSNTKEYLQLMTELTKYLNLIKWNSHFNKYIYNLIHVVFVKNRWLCPVLNVYRNCYLTLL